MSVKTYFLPINSNSLAHYFGRAIILPGGYYSNKFSDIQNRSGNALLLSSKRWVKNSDCSLELVLTESEEATLIKISDHFSLLLSPLPISRIKSVYFSNTEQSKTTLWNINNGAAFVPEQLVKIETPDDSDFIFEKEITEFKEQKESTDFARKAKYYDHILGGFSLMRIAGEPYMNYSHNYFNTFSYFNARIKQDIKKAQSEKPIRFSNDYSGMFVKSDYKWGKWQTYFYQPITLPEVEKIAIQEGLNISKRLGVPKLDSIDQNSMLYDLIVLATYGDGKNKSIDSFINEVLNEKILPNKKEELSLLVGLNNGYASLRNRYKFSSASKTVKFELLTRLDYYIIESVFQYTFHSIRDNFDFGYIDDWVTESKDSKPLKNAYKIVDSWIVPKKKPRIFSAEYLDDLFQSSANEEIYQSIAAVSTSWLPPFVSKNEAESIKYFENALKESLNRWQKQWANEIRADHEVALEEEREEMLKQFESKEIVVQQKIDFLSKENNELLLKIKELQKATSEPSPDLRETITTKEPVVKKEESAQVNYESLSVAELREIAKEKHVKPIPKSKKDLIKAIKSANPLI